MNALIYIITGGFLMSAIAMVGGLSIMIRRKTLDRMLLPLVSLAAGTLLGGALFHMIPEGFRHLEPLDAGAWLASGFLAFLALEQFLHWHHTHSESSRTQKPVTVLILVGDGVHNFLGGIGIASTFLMDIRAGIFAWIAAAAHEVPQELGDFGVLVHGGWSRRRALRWNVVSALTFPLGALLTYAFSRRLELSGLVLFGAGNFIYIAASDLIPQIKSDQRLRRAATHFSMLAAGVVVMFLLAYGFKH